jgi:hypothetical protein
MNAARACVRVKGERPSGEVSEEVSKEASEEVSCREVSCREVSCQEVSCQEVSCQEVSCQEVSGEVLGEGIRGPASACEHSSVGGGAGGGHALGGQEEQGECVCAGGVSIGGYPSVVAFTGKLCPVFRLFFYSALFSPLLPPFLNLCQCELTIGVTGAPGSLRT